MKKIFLLILLLVVGFSNVNGQTYTGMAFYDNGKPEVIKTYKVSKDKIELVKEIGWHGNGQKRWEGTLKDGERHGKWTKWYKNGRKEREGTFKDGELISAECWDKDGNERVCF
jgi:antitoxin component YwqK of YwqJK toxin-antitoxin module